MTRDIGYDRRLIALNNLLGREDITEDNLVAKVSEEEALRIVSDVLDVGDCSERATKSISVLRETYGDAIEERYGNELKLLQGNC